jgi:exosortase
VGGSKSMNNTINEGSRKSPIEKSTKGLALQSGLFAVFSLAAIICSYQPLKELMSGGRSDYYSHILLIPFVSAYFLIIDRKQIFDNVSYRWITGALTTCIGLFIYLLAWWQKQWLGVNDFASLTTFASIAIIWAGFILFFGRKAAMSASFPLLFLLFAIPVPTVLLDWFIYVLQVGSTEVTQWLFDLTRTPYFREGFVYQLPNITIEVAKECSGIRSSLALLITGVLAGHLFLRSGWKTTILLISMLPITILKNGIRILTLSLLAIHVDTKFITDSFLHHSGGFIFYLPALALMALMIWVLRKGRAKRETGIME